jgi:hypothetical protein
MLMGFLETPGQFLEHVHRSVSSFTTQMTFGFRITSEEDPVVKTLFQVNTDSCCSDINHGPLLNLDFFLSQGLCQFR